MSADGDPARDRQRPAHPDDPTPLVQPVAAEPWDIRQARVEEVLQRYATAGPPSTEAIPYDFLIPAIAADLVWEARLAPRTVSRKTVNRRLTGMREDAAKAVDDLLADPSLAMMIPLEDRLSIVRVAHLEVELQPRSKPKKEAAARVARLLVRHFKGLTGSPPGRIVPVEGRRAKPTNGRFIEILDEVYKALKIEASADHYAKSAIAMEKTSSKT
jgi:hypothetical protein